MMKYSSYPLAAKRNYIPTCTYVGKCKPPHSSYAGLLTSMDGYMHLGTINWRT